MPNAPQSQGDPNAQNTPDPQNPQNAPQGDEDKPERPEGQAPVGGVFSDVGTLLGSQYNAREIHMHVGASDFFASISNAVAGGNLLQQAFDSAVGDQLRGIFVRGGATPPPQRPEKMPKTAEEQEDWFCTVLTPFERCFVRAAAILHGAPAYMIANAAQQLFETFHPPKPATAQPAPIPDAPIPNRPLAANIFAVVRDEEDGRRLYWQDSDSNGSSEFGLMALQLIAREIEGTGGMQGYNSEPVIERWATSDDVERSWRAAHALGVIWWTLDQGRLRSDARKWATAESVAKRNSAAGLIFGAYETESDRGVKTTPESKTLALLSQLSNEARRPGSADKTQRLSHVVTTAYELIAIVSPDTALDGLDSLLGLAYQGDGAAAFSMTFAVFIYGALSYQSLACHGQIRQVLSRLAEHAERLTRLRYTTQKPGKDLLDRCEQELEILFFIFFFLVASSFPGATAQRYAHYGEQTTLEKEPEIPDSSGRDVLLASVFAEGEQATRDALVTLLCAALLNDKAKLAMDTLEQWANHLFPAEPASEHEKQLWMQYRRFVMSVGRLAGEWDREFNRTGFRSGQVWFKNLLKHWPRKKPVGQLAEEVLGRLGLTTN